MSNFSTLDKAKAKFITKPQLRFYAAIMFRLEVRYSRPGDPPVATAGTNGRVILINQQWFDELSLEQQVGLLAHEVKHVANKHHLRRGERDPGNWNVAADHVINVECKDEGLALPEDGYCDEQYRGMSTESVYNQLGDKPQSDDDPGEGDEGESGDDEGQSQGNGSGQGEQDQPGQGQPGKGEPGQGDQPGTGWGDVWDYTNEDGSQPSESEVAEAEAKLDRDIVNAGRAAKQAGHLPASAERIIQEILDPKVDWRDELRQYVSLTFRDDYSWSKGNRRYLNRGLYLPAMKSAGLVDIVCAIDTSGSMTEGQLAQIGAEIDAILQDYPARIHVVYCDARINGAEEFESSDCPVPLKMKGGGGTRFDPVFEWIEDEEIDPVLCIYFTDLHAGEPDEPDYPVIWVTDTKGMEGPFGDTIHY